MLRLRLSELKVVQPVALCKLLLGAGKLGLFFLYEKAVRHTLKKKKTEENGGEQVSLFFFSFLRSLTVRHSPMTP